ncbi:MAG: sugar phosphate isomerase/epimerase [Acidobacteriota bacterium]
MPFGLSTHLFHGARLTRRHLESIARRGFTSVEIFATRTHVDYHDAACIGELRSWLTELGLDAWSVHLPICDGFTNGVWGRAYSNASADAASRLEAVAETRRAITAARDLGCRMAVLHLGLPYGQPIPSNDNDAAAVRKSLEPIADACANAGLQLALEVIPNELAGAGAILDWLTGDLELGNTAACVDVGHAHLTGGAPDAIDILSGYIVTTHIHDNRGTADDHLVPFDGTIDWAVTMAEFSKVGYSGPLVFEVPDHGDAEVTLDRIVEARGRIQAILDDLVQPFPFEE